MIKLAHAVRDENGKSRGGNPGDQDKKEVRIQDWYKSGTGWKHVFRPKDAAKAAIIAKTAQDIANNNYIGYNQDDRLSLFYAAQNVKFDISKIKKLCNCDCSTLVACCVNAAGIKVNAWMYTGNEESYLEATGEFDTLIDKKYLAGPENLKAGDILHRIGHTAVVIDEKRHLMLTAPYMRGEDVKHLQMLIGADADGVYGPKTDAMVQAIIDAIG